VAMILPGIAKHMMIQFFLVVVKKTLSAEKWFTIYFLTNWPSVLAP